MELQALLKELIDDNKRLRRMLIEAWGFVPGEDRGRISTESGGGVAGDDRSAARWIGYMEDTKEEE